MYTLLPAFKNQDVNMYYFVLWRTLIQTNHQKGLIHTIFLTWGFSAAL